jgi:serine/threonine-protein kinase RsbW
MTSVTEAIRSQHAQVKMLTDVVPVLDRVVQAMTCEGFSERDIFAMRLSLEEAVVNAIKHGHRGDPSLEAHIRFEVTRDEAVAVVEDQGPGFDPSLVPDPLAEENLERSTGRGLLLMHAYLTWHRYNDRGNIVTLCKKRSDTDATNHRH